jgi:predicted permease
MGSESRFSGLDSIHSWSREVALGLRRLRRRPAFTALAVGTLTIGIGGATAVASLAYSVLQPLGFPDSERLVAVWETHDGASRSVAPANYLDWRLLTESFEGLAAHRTEGAAVTVDGVATRERVADVSGNFFDVLGSGPLIGRGFDPSFDSSFPDREIVLSYAGARARFGEATLAVGRTARIADVQYSVVGVMPPGFAFPEEELFGWTRSATEAPGIRNFGGDVRTMRDAWYFEVVGRVNDDVTLERATADFARVTRDLEALHPETNTAASVTLVPLLDQTVSGFGTIMLVLALAVGLILLASLSNVVNLAVVRAEEMRPEAAVRVSLGASTVDHVRGLLMEGLLIGLTSAGLGLLLADAGLRMAAARFGSAIPRAAEVGLTAGQVGPGLLLGIVAGAVVAATAYVGTRPDRPVRARLARPLGGRFVLAAQVTSAIVVLSCASTVGLSLGRLAKVDPGFDPVGVTTMRVALPDAATRSYDERVSIYQTIAEALRSTPGVGVVGLGSDSPLAMGRQATVRIQGEESEREVDAGWQPIDAAFQSALGIAVLRGRGVAASDRSGTPDVVVVNEAFARAAFGSGDGLGRRVTIGLDGHDRPLTIVGIVSNTRTRGPAADPGPVLYRPLAQTDRFSAESLLFVVRLRGDGRVGVGDVARAVAPGMPVYQEATGAELLRGYTASQRMLFAIIALFGVSALALGLIGVYGLGAQSVRRRRREIGVRLALGATGQGILRLVLLEGITTASVGVVPGLVVAWIAMSVLESQLFATGLGDFYIAPTVAVGIVLLAGAVLLLPARRAANTPPAESTRVG